MLTDVPLRKTNLARFRKNVQTRCSTCGLRTCPKLEP